MESNIRFRSNELLYGIVAEYRLGDFCVCNYYVSSIGVNLILLFEVSRNRSTMCWGYSFWAFLPKLIARRFQEFI